MLNGRGTTDGPWRISALQVPGKMGHDRAGCSGSARRFVLEQVRSADKGEVAVDLFNLKFFFSRFLFKKMNYETEFRKAELPSTDSGADDACGIE